MKACCMLLIPRHISFLLLIFCSFHMLVLFSWSNVNSNGRYAPLVKTHYKDKPSNSKIYLQKFPLEIARAYPDSARWNLSFVDDAKLPRDGIDGYIGRQRHSNLSARYKANGGSFVNVSTSHNRVSPVQLDGKMDIKDFQFATEKAWVKIKEMQPLVYSDSALKQFYLQQTGFSVEKTNVHKKNATANDIVFRYFINPEFICKRSEDSPDGAYLTVVVHSNPENKPQRDSIRNTWGRFAKNYDAIYQMRLVFVLGLANQIEEQDLIWKESKLYRDILQGDFSDSYENLSTKSLFAMHWVSNYCNDSKYMLKTDDDTYVNASLLIDWLRTLKDNANSPPVIGALNRDAKVMRKGLWQVPSSSFPFDKYPSYCTGCAYVLSTAILRDLLKTSEQIPLIPVEDAYITGILVTLIGHKCYNHRSFPQWNIGPSKINICKLVKQFLFGVHNVPYYLMYDIYGNITENSLETCSNDISTHNIKRKFSQKYKVS